jgi:hypothetical protein
MYIACDKKGNTLAGVNFGRYRIFYGKYSLNESFFSTISNKILNQKKFLKN